MFFSKVSSTVLKTVPKGHKKPFKQIAINDKDEDSEFEEDYVPPRGYEEDSDDESETSEDDESEDNVIDLVGNVPEKNRLSRKRKAKTSQGVYKRQKKRKGTNIQQKNAIHRVKEFPNETLYVEDEELNCKACKTRLSVKISTLKKHLSTPTHKDNIAKRNKSQRTLLDYRQIVQDNETAGNPAGRTLSLDVNAYRMTVSHALLRGGIPFNVLDTGSALRNLLEDGHATCPKQACSDSIPLLNKREQMATIAELDDARSFSISSDGTMNVAECLAIVSFNHLLHDSKYSCVTANN